MEYITHSAEETIKLGEKIGKFLESGTVLLLIGDLGSGKTQFSKGIGLGLGVKRIINSPTFTIVKEYQGTDLKFYHLDLYRLEGLNNDYDLDEYIESDGVCAIEWPNQIEEIIPKEHITVYIVKLEGDKRIFKFAFTPKYQKLKEKLECTL